VNLGLTIPSFGLLVDLRLDSNFMTGQIPGTLGNIAELQELWLNDNLLTGRIPGSLGNLSSLRKCFSIFVCNHQSCTRTILTSEILSCILTCRVIET
jgi:hypothetical protein